MENDYIERQVASNAITDLALKLADEVYKNAILSDRVSKLEAKIKEAKKHVDTKQSD